MTAPFGHELLKGLRDYRPLTLEDELSLLTRWRDGGDVSARNELIERVLPWAMQVAARFRRHKGRCDDLLVSAATDGVLRAVESVDPARGRLTTVVELQVRRCCRFALKKEVEGGLRACSPGVREINQAIRQREMYGRGERVPRMFAVTRPRLFRDCDRSEVQQEESQRFGTAVATDHRQPRPDQEAAWHEEQQELRAAIASLPNPRWREMLMRRLEGEYYEDIGLVFGVTHQCIRQTVKRAEPKLLEIMLANRREPASKAA